jgi:hypothetical protein
MKTVFIKKATLIILTVAVFALISLTSCEQDNVEPELNVAPGGGTLSTYKAYTLEAVTGMGNVYGRIVFWKDNASNTLVQVSLYNTQNDVLYPSGVYSGDVSAASPEQLMSLYSIQGSTGEFSTNKFYVIKDKTFYDGLATYDAHISIFSGTDAVAIGNVGANATPVAKSE